MILSDANKTTKAASKNTCKCRRQTCERKNTSLLNKNTPHDTRSHTRALNIALAVELIYAAVLSRLRLRLCMAASQYLY